MLLLYGAASFGATIHLHYCMNRLTGASLWADAKVKCGNCGMQKEASHGCCHDECKQILLQADQQVTGAGYTITAFFAPAIVPPLMQVQAVKMPAYVFAENVSHAPPGTLS